MAEAKGKKNGEGDGGAGAGVPAGGTSQAKSARMGIRLAPVGNSDQPVFANYTSLNVAPGVVFIDFGFLEPGVLAALPRVARSGGKLPETLNGRLAVRVALAYDSVQNLKRQLDQLSLRSPWRGVRLPDAGESVNGFRDKSLAGRLENSNLPFCEV